MGTVTETTLNKKMNELLSKEQELNHHAETLERYQQEIKSIINNTVAGELLKSPEHNTASAIFFGCLQAAQNVLGADKMNDTTIPALFEAASYVTWCVMSNEKPNCADKCQPYKGR